ncbi:glycosyltransferase [Alteromonas gilva]|uniref:Glycosyltransferase n=1 Tax=Alteromonas gilva TaxID=2987522 RepID=A0ABT5L163_9ALTE|nr:glycosyltransferase [Alteromonas gilva]MDC8829553.1 glycosyltransferase [Alteromonas gilva]
MIFVSVGTQLPFDRMIKLIDSWASEQDYEIIAQIGDSEIQPKNISYQKYIPFQKFNELFNRAEIIISHAGMGNIISAMDKNKPICIMPRLASLGEHRNEHQMSTAEKFSKFSDVHFFDSLSLLTTAVEKCKIKNNEFNAMNRNADEFSLRIKECLEELK